MLALYEKTEAIPGVIVYRDHQDKGQFYWMSEVPRISTIGGKPAISFVKFRRDNTQNPNFTAGDDDGGGILNFTVDLALTEEEKDDIRRAIPRHFEDVPDNIRLAPITVRDGSVRLSVMKDAADEEGADPNAPRGLQIFEEVHGSTKPSLIGAQRATFTVMLNREMATVMEQTLRGGASLFGIIYSVTFLAMRTAIAIKASAEYKRVYNHFETELGVRGTVQAVSIAADVGVAFQKLREANIVKVEVTDFTDDEELRSMRDEAWGWIKSEIIKDLFQTTLQPPAIMSPDSGGGMLGQLQGLFGALPRPTLGSSMQPQRGAPASQAPNTGTEANNLSDQVSTTADSNQAQATARSPQGSAGGGGADLAPFQVGFSLKFMRQEELRTRSFDFTMQAATTQEANPNGMFSDIFDGYNLDRHIFVVDMDDPFFDKIISTVSMGQDLSALGISSVAINMEYPADQSHGGIDHQDGFLFRPQDQESKVFTCFVNDRNDRDYRYKMKITFDPTTEWHGQDSQIETDWVVTSENTLPLAPMEEIERLEVEVGLSNLANEAISQVEVEVKYENPATGFSDERTFVLAPGSASETWKLRLAKDAPKEYSYRVRYFFADSNLRIETPFETSSDPAIIVNPPFNGTLKFKIAPMLLDASNLLSATVNVRYEEPDTGYRVLIDEEFDGFTPLTMKRFEIPTIAADPAPVVFDTTIIKMDGSVTATNDQEAVNGVILLTEGEGTIQRLRVQLPQEEIGDLTALRVEFTGSGDEPDETSVLFTPSATEPQFISLVQPHNAAREYNFTVTGYDAAGVPTEIASGNADDMTFIVPMA